MVRSFVSPRTGYTKLQSLSLVGGLASCQAMPPTTISSRPRTMRLVVRYEDRVRRLNIFDPSRLPVTEMATRFVVNVPHPFIGGPAKLIGALSATRKPARHRARA